MEITLEKIELVKDRTGVTYKEAKDALEAADGSVVDAIINIEETIDMSGSAAKIGEQGARVIDNIKAVVKKGNVTKIVVKKDDEKILNFPITVSIVGTVLAPWAAIAGIIATFGFKCTIELVKDDGTVIDVTEKATDTFGDVVEKGGDVAGGVKDKGAEVFSNIKNKTSDIWGKAKDSGNDSFEEFKEKYDDLKESASDRMNYAKNKASDVTEDFKDVKDAAVNAAKGFAEEDTKKVKVEVENLKDDLK
jgi:gas vesicle protein